MSFDMHINFHVSTHNLSYDMIWFHERVYLTFIYIRFDAPIKSISHGFNALYCYDKLLS